MLSRVHESFMVTPPWDEKRVLVFTQRALSRIMVGEGPAGFTLRSEAKESAFCTYRRGGGRGEEESAGGRAREAHVAHSKVRSRAQTNKPCWVWAVSA